MSQRKAKTPQEIAEQYVSTVSVKTLDGTVKQYQYMLLKRRVAAEVHYKTLNAVIRSLIAVASIRGGGFSQGTVATALDMVDFDTLWMLGEKLLKGAIVDGVTIQYEDYFGDNPDELIFAVISGVKANYPDVFSKVRERFRDFDLPGLVAKMKEKIPGLDTGSLQEQ